MRSAKNHLRISQFNAADVSKRRVAAFPRNFNTRRSIPGISTLSRLFPSFFSISPSALLLVRSTIIPQEILQRYLWRLDESAILLSPPAIKRLFESWFFDSLPSRVSLAIEKNFEDSFPGRIWGSRINYTVVTMGSRLRWPM